MIAFSEREIEATLEIYTDSQLAAEYDFFRNSIEYLLGHSGTGVTMLEDLIYQGSLLVEAEVCRRWRKQQSKADAPPKPTE